MICKKDFFISYTQNDKEWAVWIDEVFKTAGYTTILQACDYGMEIEIDHALKNSECFICVLSKEYQNSHSCLQAWSSAYKTDTSSRNAISSSEDAVKPLFIPVKIEDIKQEGLLATRNYVSLYRHGKTDKGKQNLLEAVKSRPIRHIPEEIGTVNFAEKRNIIKNMQYPRNPYFIGRHEILDSINKNLKINGIVSLIQSDSNLIGIGKTEIALEYAHLHEDRYETIWWLNAEKLSSMLTAFNEFAKQKQIISKDAKEKDIIEALKYWFNNNKEWLFIYDNANANDFRKWLEQFLPQQTKNGHIIITTRSGFFPKCKSLIKIPVFTEMEAVSFFKKRTDKSGGDYSDDFAKILAECLMHLPIALEQAATYIEQNPGVTYQDCVEFVKEYGTDVFKNQLTGGK